MALPGESMEVFPLHTLPCVQAEQSAVRVLAEAFGRSRQQLAVHSCIPDALLERRGDLMLESLLLQPSADQSEHTRFLAAHVEFDPHTDATGAGEVDGWGHRLAVDHLHARHHLLLPRRPLLLRLRPLQGRPPRGSAGVSMSHTC
eukprot:2386409-Rhodomonas_salina.1